MSILNFLDTVYDTAQHSLRYGKPNPLIAGDQKYDYNSLRYPLDIGSADKGHYMVIHINNQTKTQFEPSGYSSQLPTVVENQRRLTALRGGVNSFGATRTLIQGGSNAVAAAQNQFSDELSSLYKLGGEASKAFGATQIGQAFSSGFETISAASKNITGEQGLRTLKRTTDSIVLYMPDTLTFEYRQNYDELRLGSDLGGTASMLASIYDAYNQGGATRVGQIAAPFIASSVLGGFGDFGRALSAGALGVVQNPMLELIYSQPNFRTFQFDFMFYPRDEKEALEVQKILDRLRFHQAPEIKDSTYGYFLIPPSEFDIKFYYNGKINPNIDRISTCVLENIVVNYSPSGFSAYESLYESSPSLGRTGMPVAIQLTLMFKETQILTKEVFSPTRYEQMSPEEVDSSFVETPDITESLLNAINPRNP
jgi:hypothetical protein